MAKRTVKDLAVKGKKVIVRVDFNVPLKGGVITDENRIVQALPTINYLVEQGAKIILLSHLGKVDHKDPEKKAADMKKNNMAPVAEALAKKVSTKVTFVADTRGADVEKAVADLKDGEIVVLQNTRYEKGESKNDPELSKYWASLGDLFVTDAFGSVHRAHSSTVGIAEILPSALGFLVEKEVNQLSRAVYNPERPFVAILGGSKVSDKIPVIENLLKTADKILVGGGMAFTFEKAQGKEIGTSLLDADSLELTKKFMAEGKDKIVLPVDYMVADKFAEDADHYLVDADKIPAGYMGLDVGPKTLELFASVLAGAKTVVWNGPMGVFEMKPYAAGTIGVCETLANMKDAFTVIGGGDSAAAANQNGFADAFSHISTGGGASLEFMEGKELPGIAVIQDK